MVVSHQGSRQMLTFAKQSRSRRILSAYLTVSGACFFGVSFPLSPAYEMAHVFVSIVMFDISPMAHDLSGNCSFWYAVFPPYIPGLSVHIELLNVPMVRYWSPRGCWNAPRIFHIDSPSVYNIIECIRN